MTIGAYGSSAGAPARTMRSVAAPPAAGSGEAGASASACARARAAGASRPEALVRCARAVPGEDRIAPCSVSTRSSVSLSSWRRRASSWPTVPPLPPDDPPAAAV